jgi:hypothetical protein
VRVDRRVSGQRTANSKQGIGLLFAVRCPRFADSYAARTSLILPVLAALLLVTGCDVSSRRTAHNALVPALPPVVYETIDSPSMQFLPRQQEAPGWTLQADPLVIRPQRLASYTGTDTRKFTTYGVLDLTAGNYTGQNGTFATAEIYRFPDFVKAFGAYSAAKVPGVQFIDIPNESFTRGHSIHVWRGPFYIRVIGSGPLTGLFALAGFIADKMPPAPGKPAVFSFFPDKMRVPNSERYSALEGLGQKSLGNSFQASFNADGQNIDALIIPAGSRELAARILDSYRNLYVRNGKLLDPVPNLGEDNFTAEDRYLGRAVAFRIDRFVIAVSGYGERQKLVDLAIATHQKIVGTIRKQLVSAEDQADNSRTHQ